MLANSIFAWERTLSSASILACFYYHWWANIVICVHFLAFTASSLHYINIPWHSYISVPWVWFIHLEKTSSSLFMPGTECIEFFPVKSLIYWSVLQDYQGLGDFAHGRPQNYCGELVWYSFQNVIHGRNSLQWLGIEPRSTAWKAAMLTTIPPSLRKLQYFYQSPCSKDRGGTTYYLDSPIILE